MQQAHVVVNIKVTKMSEKSIQVFYCKWTRDNKILVHLLGEIIKKRGGERINR